MYIIFTSWVFFIHTKPLDLSWYSETESLSVSQLVTWQMSASLTWPCWNWGKICCTANNSGFLISHGVKDFFGLRYGSETLKKWRWSEDEDVYDESLLLIPVLNAHKSVDMVYIYLPVICQVVIDLYSTFDGVDVFLCTRLKNIFQYSTLSTDIFKSKKNKNLNNSLVGYVIITLWTHK